MPKELGSLYAPHQADERRMIELAVWTLQVGVTIRAANYQLALSVDVGDGAGEQIFSPLPFTREPISAQANLQVDEVQVTFPNASLGIETATPIVESLASVALSGALDGSTLKIYILDLNTHNTYLHSDWYMTGAPAITRNAITVQLQSGMSLLTRECPKTSVHAECNNALFNTWCTLDEDAWAVGGLAEAGNETELYDSARGEAANWFNGGRLMMLAGQNFGSVRTIMLSEPGYLLMMVPFHNAIAADDQYVAWPGCDKKLETCRDKFNNLANYRGFPQMPPAEIMQGL